MRDLTICICTSGRSSELRRCLESIAAGSVLPADVIVSDDSASPESARAISNLCGEYPFVRHLPGPRRGLCANRNHVIRSARTSHVSLVDDDAVVSAGFVRDALACIDADRESIVTGDVLEDGVTLTAPTNPTWLGYFGRPIRAGEQLRNMNLNCNVIPLRAFSAASFDERIVYGYEDTDVCDRWVRAGWTIRHEPSLINSHLPPTPSNAKNRRAAESEVARIRVTVRRLARTSRFLAIAWLPLAMGHALLSVARFGQRKPLITMAREGIKALFEVESPPLVQDLPVDSSMPACM